MVRTNKILSIAAASALMFIAAPSSLWAESAAPNGDAANFLTGITCPDEFSGIACYDPQAAGTRYSASLSVTYDKDGTMCAAPDGSGPRLRNVYFNLTLRQSNSSAIATTEYKNGVRPHTGPICFLSIESEQARTIIDLIRVKALPLVNCTQGACNFKIKSVTNFQYTAGDDPTSGGFSVDMSIAVK